MKLFILRILKLYFRDKTAVFFSLLSSFIIIGLYMLFLGKTYSKQYNEIEQVGQLMNQWIMAGILATNSVSTTTAVSSIMVDDKAKNIQKDFYCSPVKNIFLEGSYILATLIIGFILSIVTLNFAQIYIFINGGIVFSLMTYIKIIMTLILVVSMNGSMMFFISSLFKSNHAFSTASTIIGTIIGFLTGIYVPIGSLPSLIQWIIKLFPTSHGAALLRLIMMEKTMGDVFDMFPNSVLTEFKEMLGISYHFHHIMISPIGNAIYLISFTFLFVILSLWIYKIKERRY